MNKNMKLVAIVVALAVSYPAASWYTGKRVEAKMVGTQDVNASSPYVKVLKQEYKRGIFSSEQDVTLQITFAKSPALTDAAADAGADNTAKTQADAASNADKASGNIELRVINHVKHGPLPGFTGFGAARVDTELVLDAKSQEQLTKLFGTAKPLEITSRLGYGGSGHVTISSPAINTVTEKQDKVAWQGFKLNMDFEKDYKTFMVSANAPGLTIDGKDGQLFKLGALAATADISRAYTTGNLYLGKTELAISDIHFDDQIETKQSFHMEQVKLATDTNLKDELVSMFARVGISKMKINQDEFSDVHYDYGVKRIHGPSFAKLLEAYSNMAGNPEKAAELKAVWEEVAPAILQKEPEIALERISVVTADGEAKLTGSAKLVGANAADLANPMMMLPKIQATLDVALTDSLVAKLGTASQKDPEMQKVALETMNKQISAFIEKGFVTRAGKILTSKLEWIQGKLTVNGKAFSR